MRSVLALLIFLLPAIARAEPVCIAPPHLATETEDERYLARLIADLRPTLSRHPTLTAALEDLGPDLCLAEETSGAKGQFDPATMRIVLARGHHRFLHQAILLQELRHLDQFARGLCPHDALTPSERARATRAMEADASAISILLAWERLMNGDAGVWEAMLAWPSQADIAVELAREFFRTGFPAAMAEAAFTQWYASNERRERDLGAACSTYLERREIAPTLPAQDELPDDFLDLLCLLPDGSRYPCADRDGRRR